MYDEILGFCGKVRRTVPNELELHLNSTTSNANVKISTSLKKHFEFAFILRATFTHADVYCI